MKASSILTSMFNMSQHIYSPTNSPKRSSNGTITRENPSHSKHTCPSSKTHTQHHSHQKHHASLSKHPHQQEQRRAESDRDRQHTTERDASSREAVESDAEEDEEEEFFESFETSPILQNVFTGLTFILLGIVGRIRDALRRSSAEIDAPSSPALPANLREAEHTDNSDDDATATARGTSGDPEPPQEAPLINVDREGFVPIYNDYEAFYTRNLFRRVYDCWNRPICSAPDSQIRVIERIRLDHGWKFKYSGRTRTVTNFGSYNYLGFAQTRGSCADAALASISERGLGLASSRHEAGSCALQSQLEREFAQFVGQEAVLVFPMGFATNSLNIPCLVDKHCCVISDELNHTSLILGIRQSKCHKKVFSHNDMDSLEAKLREAVIYGDPRTRRPFKKILILCEGIYSMEGSIVRLRKMITLKKKYKAYLYLDEAHSIGALGTTGRGVVEYSGVEPSDIDVAMGTFTKSFGSAGGYIAGSRRLIQYLRESSHAACYAASMSAPVAQQIISSLRIISGREGGDLGQQKIRQLAWNTRYFRAGLHQRKLLVYGNRDSPVVPMLTYNPTKMTALSRHALEHGGIGIVVVGFPATKPHLSRARFCISASHTREQLDAALTYLDAMADVFGIRNSRLELPRWALRVLRKAALTTGEVTTTTTTTASVDISNEEDSSQHHREKQQRRRQTHPLTNQHTQNPPHQLNASVECSHGVRTASPIKSRVGMTRQCRKASVYKVRFSDVDQVHAAGSKLI